MGRKAKPAIFLDRDGVLIVEKSYIRCIAEIEIFSYAKTCVSLFHEKGYYAIVITNQSGIARGFFSEEMLCEMNQYLIKQIGIDAVYYCPHHACGHIKKYSYKCNCRKPQTGLLERACRDFGIDLEHSILVGDRASDIQTGKNIGITTVLLESGYGSARLERYVEPDYIFDDLRGVLDICSYVDDDR